MATKKDLGQPKYMVEFDENRDSLHPNIWEFQASPVENPEEKRSTLDKFVICHRLSDYEEMVYQLIISGDYDEETIWTPLDLSCVSQGRKVYRRLVAKLKKLVAEEGKEPFGIKCPECGIIKEEKEFGSHSKRRNGHQAWCKECNRSHVEQKQDYLSKEDRDALLKKKAAYMKVYRAKKKEQNND